ncbi:MAG: coproporphyrinogen III oxidase, partial [Candidatus Puniceispirillaceae bacterium]
MINRTPPDFLTPDMADFSVRVADWFEKLRDNICGQFETIESDAEDSPLSNQPSGHFQRKNWTRDGGGGGQISVM